LERFWKNFIVCIVIFLRLKVFDYIRGRCIPEIYYIFPFFLTKYPGGRTPYVYFNQFRKKRVLAPIALTGFLLYYSHNTIWPGLCPNQKERRTMPIKVITFLLFALGVSWSQSIDADSDEFSSCSLSIRAKVLAPDFGETFGRALVIATLSTIDGAPIANKEIHMTVTPGVFSCLPPDSFSSMELSSADRYCFITDQEGKMEVYVDRIPINKPGIVKASFPFGEGVIKASCPFAITKRTVKRKLTDPALSVSAVQTSP
jgi:hypothetical protein